MGGINSAIAAKLAAAKPTQSGNVIRPGNYVFECIKMLFMPQGNGVGQAFGGDMFVIELSVLESSPTGELSRDGKPINPNAPGTVASYVINLSKMQNGGGDVKTFLMALLGEPEENITADVITGACSDEQPYKYLKVKDQAWNKPQKGDPRKDFTRHRWETIPMTEADLISIAQRRSAEAATPAK